MKMKLSENFKLAEFECHGENCCEHTCAIDLELIESLEQVRNYLNTRGGKGTVRLEIKSGFRCNKHNREVGGVLGSLHTLGCAADVVPIGCSVIELAEAAVINSRFKKGGIGIYKDFVHLDIRSDGPYRWDNHRKGTVCNES